MPDDPYIQRKNIRLKDYDYSSAGAYMVTICANGRITPVFGTLSNGKIELSEIGRVTEKAWLKIPEHFPGVSLDEWIIMPDHVHGILLFSGEACLAPTTASTDRKLPGLGAVVGSFKSAVTREARNCGVSRGPFWQRGYYEHVIRDEAELDRVRDYILTNPLRWFLDRENPFASRGP